MKLYSKFVGIHNNIRLISKITLLIAVLLYFGFHAISGENGLASYISIKQNEKTQEEKLEKLKLERAYLQQRVALLGSKSLDLDILEERCRVVLNYCYPNEIIIREKSIKY